MKYKKGLECSLSNTGTARQVEVGNMWYRECEVGDGYQLRLRGALGEDRAAGTLLLPMVFESAGLLPERAYPQKESLIVDRITWNPMYDKSNPLPGSISPYIQKEASGRRGFMTSLGVSAIYAGCLTFAPILEVLTSGSVSPQMASIGPASVALMEASIYTGAKKSGRNPWIPTLGWILFQTLEAEVAHEVLTTSYVMDRVDESDKKGESIDRHAQAVKDVHEFERYPGTTFKFHESSESEIQEEIEEIIRRLDRAKQG